MGKTLAYKILENRPDFNTGLNRYYGIPAA